MSSPAAAAQRILITDFQPATFLERGATVPFTSPLLQQARIRLGPGGLREVVMRNPSGGPGWYVGPWDGVVAMARVTVHDRLVYKRIEETGAVTPLELRRAARSVAAEGYGGPAAKEAALAALAGEEREWRAAYATLLATLLGQAGLAGSEAIGRARSRQELIALAPQLVAPIAPRLGLAADTLARALEECATLLARIGASGDAPTQTARDLAAAERLIAEVKALAAEDHRADPDAVHAILVNGELTAALARDALARARAEAMRPQALLLGWAENEAATRARLTRAEWLLDGWAYLVSLWDTAAEQAPGRQRHVLPELHGLLPPLPREVTGAACPVTAPPVPGRKVARGQEWQAGIADADQVARNERALARSVA
ncbi:hypothetical protein [Elioraea sp. Yellowstone]|uniref:hypothetical protein n=1 Tax=Elioraea sp. Yellowstone TaxID=2592070 RepID=UPI0013866AAE|nr:hypothetical protein [Elioraea sp. Yellowstone]